MATDVDIAEDNFNSPLYNIPKEQLEQDLWTEECLIDEVFLRLAGTKSAVEHNDKSITIHKYYNQAHRLGKWICIAKPVPVFIVNISDLTPRIIAELKALDDPEYVLKSAVGRIFENIDFRQYHLSIAAKLKVRLQD
jgi:hypothetical protein